MLEWVTSSFVKYVVIELWGENQMPAVIVDVPKKDEIIAEGVGISLASSQIIDFMINPDPSKADEIIASTIKPIWIGLIV